MTNDDSSSLVDKMQSCSLRDLNLADKKKVAKLIKQVVALKQNNDSASLNQNKIMKELERRNRQLNLRNREIIKENANSRSKLMQALVMIKSYQQQIRALEKGKELRESIDDNNKCRIEKTKFSNLDVVVEEETKTNPSNGLQTTVELVEMISQGTNTEHWMQLDESNVETRTELSPLRLKFDPLVNPHGQFIELQRFPNLHDDPYSFTNSQQDSHELHYIDNSLLDLIKEVEVIAKIYDQNEELNQPWMSSRSTNSTESCASEQELLCDLFLESQFPQ